MRVGSARTEAVALRKPIFAAQHVALNARVTLFQNLVGTKLTFQIGIWKAWRHATLALYRTLLPDNQRHAVSSWSLHSLCVCLGIPHPDSLVSVARRQVFDHLAHADNGGLKLLMDELRHELSWVEAVRRDLRSAAQSGYFDSELRVSG